jgi:hypothetical protein
VAPSANAWPFDVPTDSCAYLSLRIGTETVGLNVAQAKINRTKSARRIAVYKREIRRLVDTRNSYLRRYNNRCQPTVEQLLAQAASDPEALRAWGRLLELVLPGGISGSAGPPGPQGPAGPAGAQGEIGPTGAAGAQGAIGPTGATGAQGSQGIQGEAGATGPAGAQGSQGATGATGGQGAQGIQGIQGEVGPIGPQGVQGEQGATGADGADGAQGAQGERGATGETGETGATGAQGIQGVQGIQGEIGPTGATGAEGADGATGADGAPGADGSPGAQGVQGEIGATGPQGEPGPPGPTGATGATGEPGEPGVVGSLGYAGYPDETTFDNQQPLLPSGLGLTYAVPDGATRIAVNVSTECRGTGGIGDNRRIYGSITVDGVMPIGDVGDQVMCTGEAPTTGAMTRAFTVTPGSTVQIEIVSAVNDSNVVGHFDDTFFTVIPGAG